MKNVKITKEEYIEYLSKIYADSDQGFLFGLSFYKYKKGPHWEYHGKQFVFNDISTYFESKCIIEKVFSYMVKIMAKN